MNYLCLTFVFLLIDDKVIIVDLVEAEFSGNSYDATIKKL